MELHLYPDMVILPDFCFFVYSFAKKMTNKIPRKICKKVRQYTIYTHLRQLNKNKVAESLDFTGVMPLFMFKRMLYGNTTLKFF